MRWRDLTPRGEGIVFHTRPENRRSEDPAYGGNQRGTAGAQDDIYFARRDPGLRQRGFDRPFKLVQQVRDQRLERRSRHPHFHIDLRNVEHGFFGARQFGLERPDRLEHAIAKVLLDEIPQPPELETGRTTLRDTVEHGRGVLFWLNMYVTAQLRSSAS